MSNKKLITLIITLCLSLFISQSLHAETLDIDSIKGPAELGDYMEVLEDSENRFTINDVTGEDLSGKFSKVNKNILNFGFTGSSYWVRFRMHNQTYYNKNLFLHLGFSIINDSEIYLFNSLGKMWEDRLSLSRSFSERTVQGRIFTYRLPLNISDTYICYLKVNSEYALILNPTLLWERDLIDRNKTEIYFHGIFFGIIIIIMMYSIMLSVNLKDKCYLYYFMFLACFLIYQHTYNGLSMEFIWPDSPRLNYKAYAVFMNLTSLWGLLFTRSFLQLGKQSNKLYTAFYTLIGACIFSSLLSFFLPMRVMVISGHLMASAAAIWIFSSAIDGWRKGQNFAKHFLYAFSPFLLGVIAIVLRNAGYLPHNFITEYGVEVSSIIFFMLLSFALADRVKLLKTEKDEYQSEIIETQKSAVKFMEKTGNMKNEFFADSTKELRYPLDDIINIAESLMEDDKSGLNEYSHQNLLIIASKSKNLRNLVNNIIDYSTSKIGDIKLHKKKLDINELAGLIIFFLKAEAGEKGIILKNEIPANLPHIYGDENRCMQILLNLINNSIKYTDSGDIIISAREVKKYLEVTIRDSGSSIPTHRLDEIIMDTDHVDNLPVHDLDSREFGLSVSKKLIEMHGGTMKIESVKGEGTIFTFTCRIFDPVHDNDQDLHPETDDRYIISENINKDIYPNQNTGDDAEVPDINVLKNSNINTKILVVDDEPVNVQILNNQLGIVGYDVFTAADGNQALDIINSRNVPDLVLLDIMLPGMSGYEVCRRLREKFSLYDLPVIMLTVKNQIKDLVQGFEVGANDYLTKPFDKIELLARVATLITLKKLAKKYEETRYREMQKRMNPHFLFNALHSIHAMLAKNSELADRGIIMLADIYRFIMDRSFEKLIHFDLEWTFVKDYLEMEKLRFPDSLEYEMHKIGDCSGVSIPPLIIQPLVENSIKHGVRNKPGPGFITITVKKEESKLTIEVKDNGIGVIGDNIYSRTLGNIKERLQYYYGGSSLVLRNRPDGGAVAVISVNL